MKRGDIYWVNLDPTVGSEIRKKRPCVLVGASSINRARHTVVVVPLSTQVTKSYPPITIPVSCLGKSAVAVCDQIRAVDKARLVGLNPSAPQSGPAGQLSVKEMHALDDALRQVLTL